MENTYFIFDYVTIFKIEKKECEDQVEGIGLENIMEGVNQLECEIGINKGLGAEKLKEISVNFLEVGTAASKNSRIDKIGSKYGL